jgi:hypothetical protein
MRRIKLEPPIATKATIKIIGVIFSGSNPLKRRSILEFLNVLNSPSF